ncbi:MAG: Asp23/Gls24 family envelope stress response protein [Dictyoglomus sp.]|nr:Asp23/Gls24 family envelope stress response protein [Dictyoglomus sp.]MCX7941912.1 Asp23/Gls24 family envelope stress response protein [Dictyoglomaceae bacterium]MDW8188603.1 Asp23/Gls24 family envelope stress response protein [Dictyoglomus sp.]
MPWIQDFIFKHEKSYQKYFTGIGWVEISENAIATLASLSALQSYGVIGMAARNIADGISELLHREELGRGVQVRIAEDGLIIELYIIVAYGVRIPEVAHNVMERVKWNLEKTTGLTVKEINVNIWGIRLMEEKKESFNWEEV